MKWVTNLHALHGGGICGMQTRRLSAGPDDTCGMQGLWRGEGK